MPLDEESTGYLAFQTHEEIFTWDRLTMGAMPSSSVQQGAYNDALDQYTPREFQYRFADQDRAPDDVPFRRQEFRSARSQRSSSSSQNWWSRSRWSTWWSAESDRT